MKICASLSRPSKRMKSSTGSTARSTKTPSCSRSCAGSFAAASPNPQRRGFLFSNVTDGKKTKYNCSVLVGGLSGSEAIYSLGLKCQPDEVPDRWIYALDHLDRRRSWSTADRLRKRCTWAPNCLPTAASTSSLCRFQLPASTTGRTSPPAIGSPRIRRPASATSATTAA